jgi:hypothetical protein
MDCNGAEIRSKHTKNATAGGETIHDEEIKGAKSMDRCEPDWSNTIEMLLRKGVKAYKPSSTS